MRLRTLRANRGLSQEELSKASGVLRQIISGLEKGARPRPEDGTLERLAEALAVTSRQLRGCEAIPDLLVAEVEGEVAAQGAAQQQAEAETDEAAAAAAAAAMSATAGARAPGSAVGLTSLLTLPPGATLLQKSQPDGSVVLYVRIPAGDPRPSA